MSHTPPSMWLEARACLEPADAEHLARARSLVSAMTLEEKLPFLHQHSPGVDRLGIGPFSTGTEALHGVAWRGHAVTYPQPVGLAATWDPQLLEAIGEQIAQEVRVHHEHQEAASLNVWAPVVNALRHPLWGRNEEGLTEDPLLNAQLGAAIARGLRGRGDEWTTVPTLKHFLAYSNEVDRAATSSSMPPRVLHEYELPGFEEALASGAAGAVMLAYNLVDGVPAHLSPLVNEHLRRLVADPDLLFVVSDAGAPTNLVTIQDAAEDLTEAVAAMLVAGVDSFTDHGEDTEPTLRAARTAWELGLIEERHIDRAVVRQLVARARTGEFDSPGTAAAARPTFDPAAAVALSEQAAARSAVLLRHEHETLPARSGERIALLGHLGGTVLTDWYSGQLIEPRALDAALRAAHDGVVIHAPCLDLVTLADEEAPVVHRPDGVLHVTDAATPGSPVAGASFEVIDHGLEVISLREVGTGRLIAPDGAGHLAARSKRIGGWIVQETFRRCVDATGGVRLQHVGSGRWVRREHRSGRLLLGGHGPENATRWQWQVMSSRRDQAVEAMAGADLVIVVGGNDPHVHGRETEDRPSLSLMEPDRELLELLQRTRTSARSALLMISSYPYDLAEHAETAEAVVWSSHGGARLGPALASLLLGHREFSGRLAQAWIPQESLTGILDYDVISSAATYLYGQESVFPFGHGLTLSPTQWEHPAIMPTHNALHATVTLERDDNLPAYEVVQIYVSADAEQYSADIDRVPTMRLIGSKIAVVPASGSTRVELEVAWTRLRLWSPEQERFVGPERAVTIHLARSSRDTVASREVSIPHR